MIADVIDAQTQPNAEGGPDAPDRAFADVAREQLDGLYGYCIRLAKDRTEAEDLVQDTLLRAMRAYPGLRDETKVKTWLFTIATNAWRDLCRARGRTLATVSLDDADGEDDFSLFTTLAIEDPFPYSDELHLDFLRLFRDEDVQDVFARINPLFRTPLILTTIHGFSCKEAGTILVALDGTARGARPCLMRVAGGKDVESWTAFFATLAGEPRIVVADLDAAIGRAVRETWPGTILVPSRHHVAAQMRERALADGVPERIRADAPIPLDRPLPWTAERTKRWTSHPLHDALLSAQRGPTEWAAFLALVERHVPPDRLALRGWIATNEPLIRRGRLIAARHPDAVRSTGALEGAIGEWLAPLRRRAGRWQNARRFDLVLGLMTLRGRGEAREARYAGIVRAAFAARGNRSHLPGENELPHEVYRGEVRQMSWWRTWHDRTEASLPRLVREADRRWRRRAAGDHATRVKERLTHRYATEVDLRTRLGLPAPPTGRPQRAAPREAASVRGRLLADYPDLLEEWAWDVNADLDPARLAAGSHERVAWRCLLDPTHVWETRVADRTYHDSACPYHMGVRVHPAGSLAAFYPWLALEWQPSRNELRPDQVTRASAREVIWRCELGHEWSAAVYQRTLSGTGCPDCYRLAAPARTTAGQQRARRARDTAAIAEIVALPASPSAREAV